MACEPIGPAYSQPRSSRSWERARRTTSAGSPDLRWISEILLPQDRGNTGQGGSDVSRSVVIGDGPAEVVVNAGVGIGQLTVVKE